MLRQVVLAVTTLCAFVGMGVLSAHMSGDSARAEPSALHPRRIVVGIDLSRSNPMIENEAIAAKIGRRVADEISKLDYASKIYVRTFGDYDTARNTFSYDVVLSRYNRPEKVAADVGRLIASTPALVRSGKWRSQGNTNIIAFLNTVSRSIGCDGMPTTIILATDGLEDSEFATLADADDHLPTPGRKGFKGCAELQILGLGQGTGSPKTAERLYTEWNRWARAAGFAKFSGLADW